MKARMKARMPTRKTRRISDKQCSQVYIKYTTERIGGTRGTKVNGEGMKDREGK